LVLASNTLGLGLGLGLELYRSWRRLVVE